MKSKRIKLRIKKAVRLAQRKLYLTQATPTSRIPARFSIDSPTVALLDKKRISVEGWIIPYSGHTIHGLHINYCGAIINIPFEINRPDVARAFPGLTGAIKSGFATEIDYISDDELSIEADLGKGYVLLHKINIRYSPERLARDYFNPVLSDNMVEHLSLIQSRNKYYYEESQIGEYRRQKEDPKLVAFYLPQFHPIPENDEVWGKGFTEWSNVTTAVPRFAGHQQPILPSDLGFYDLRLESTIKDQITLAKQHGIYGFCFYYYWFSGKRLLEKPLNSFLKHKDWDFSFTICWANENWTKRWDGRDNEVIVAQKYTKEDPLKFIKDVENILLDPRYIQEDGKPVLMVYRASELKDPARYAKVWREYFKAKHNKELHLVSVLSFEDTDPRTYGFDAALDFAPQSSFFKNRCFKDNRYPYLNVTNRLLDINFEGNVADYRQVALNDSIDSYFDFPIYKCVTPSWDNDARKKGKGFVMYNNNPDLYVEWLDRVLGQETARTESPLVFINAWNEWAEGAILEPTTHFGHAVLNRTTEVLAKYSSTNDKQLPMYGITRTPNTKLAVVIHLYYPERWEFIKEKLSHLGDIPYDLYVTLNEKDGNFVPELKKFNKDVYIKTVPNRGRDILPFLYIAQRLKQAGYKNVLKIHSKKTLHRENGSDWFEELITNLLPDETMVQKINQETTASTALVGPAGHYLSLKRYMGSNEPHLKTLLDELYGQNKTKNILNNSNKYGYFAGSMFWVSLAALEPLIGLHMSPEDFELENGQIDGTMAHAVERLVSLMCSVNGTKLFSAGQAGLGEITQKDKSVNYKYAD